MAVDIEQPILWEAVEDAISQWITDTLGIATQWADQDAPQPARPFVEMSIDGPIELGVDDEKRTIETAPGSDDWQEQTRGEREITISTTFAVAPGMTRPTVPNFAPCCTAPSARCLDDQTRRRSDGQRSALAHLDRSRSLCYRAA